MSTPLAQLAFTLQSPVDHLSAAMQHTLEYEKLTINANSLHSVTLQCLLPDDAHEGDAISLSATQVNVRGSHYFSEKKLTQAHLDTGYVNLQLNKISTSQCFVMQMMLHGKHATLKNSIQFDIHINAYQQGYKQTQVKPSNTKKQSVKHYFSSMSSTFLSLF
ncbi:hypothetical protein J8L70_10020 [Pseudoalteromonas sp. MMG010]|uniref:hypothetical protein n=1 Tax=Pseudoalteromonas sp. MMG010 TaxID=2822685 RepID=UPI001B3A6F49|nr:hypothetical protein [Pseudoalteromonas sp. MMG010]MBQ4833575.1 hypothetical protein [Pseudoalteromonas sp. MMG010]